MFGKRRRFKTVYFIASLSLSLFLVHRFVFSFGTVFRATISTVSYPVFLAQEKIVFPLRKYVAKKKKTKELFALLEAEREQKERLFAENIKLYTLLRYQAKTKPLIQFAQQYDFSQVKLAHIIFRQFHDDAQFLLLDKGSRHGVAKDMVAVHKNNLLGKITEVYPFYSKLILLSDRSCKVAAHCAKTNASGIHTGQNCLGCSKLKRVSHLSRVQEGDLVLSSGEGLVFPQGFALGTIESVKPDGLYHAVTVKPAVDLQLVTHCCLIRKGDISA